MENNTRISHRVSPLVAPSPCRSPVSPIINFEKAYASQPTVRNVPENNQCKMVEYRSAKIAAFMVEGREMICLPQAFDVFLKHLVGGLHTVYTKLKRLSISPMVCNVEQVRILRGLGAIQPGVNRCKLISCQDFDTLYEDCTSSSSRPGRPPKRSSPTNSFDGVHHHKVKKQKHDPPKFSPVPGLDGRFFDPKLLFNPGYPYSSLGSVPFMHMHHPLLPSAVAMATQFGQLGMQHSRSHFADPALSHIPLPFPNLPPSYSRGDYELLSKSPKPHFPPTSFHIADQLSEDMPEDLTNHNRVDQAEKHDTNRSDVETVKNSVEMSPSNSTTGKSKEDDHPVGTQQHPHEGLLLSNIHSMIQTFMQKQLSPSNSRTDFDILNELNNEKERNKTLEKRLEDEKMKTAALYKRVKRERKVRLQIQSELFDLKTVEQQSDTIDNPRETTSS